MSINFNGTNPDYLSTTTSPPSSTLSYCAFCYFPGTAGGHKNNVIAITNTNGTDGTQAHNIYLFEDSTTAGHFTYSNPNGTIIANFAASQILFGQWVFVALSMNGTAVTVYWKNLGGPGFQTSTGTGVAFTPAYVAIGSDAAGTQQMNGFVAGTRIWNGVLTAADFEIESQCVEPFRTPDLWADWRMDSDLDLRDRIRGNLLTAAGPTNITQGPQPPIAQYRIPGVV
jgi:Concanavalin A-like lectin/glucanases superfamily